jgi:hypothetical protein
MNEILARIAAAAGLDEATATKAIGLILGFLQKEGPAGPVAELIAKFPGAPELIQAASGGGGLMGMIGSGMGGIMGLGSQLMGAGLSMPQIQTVSKELFAVAREHVGDEIMGEIVQNVPGLNQFI